MKFLPYENITFISQLGEPEVMGRLADSIEPMQFVRKYSVFSDNNPVTKTFEGEMNGNEFHVQRIIIYRNSFLPKISGKIDPQASGTAIHVKMRLNSFVLVLMSAWLGGVGFAFLFFLFQMISTWKFSGAIFIVFGVFWIGFCLVFYGFKHESDKARQEFIRLLEAEIEAR